MNSLNQTLLQNTLLSTLLRYRIDTAWRMLALDKQGLMPQVYDEGATGSYDNKGAIFVPGGLVVEDSDKNPIERTYDPFNKKTQFEKNIAQAMQYDNATLFFHDGLATGINIDNGFFSEMASDIIANKISVYGKRSILKAKPPVRYNSNHITKSFVPKYMEPPYGSRTKISSCIAACMVEPKLYYVLCRSRFGFRLEDRAIMFWENLRKAFKAISIGNNCVFPPAIVVCHTTRYKASHLCGIIRILGYGKYGEFSTLTIEKLSSELHKELNSQNLEYTDDHVLFHWNNSPVLCLVRNFKATSPGKRLNKFETKLIAPENEMGLTLEDIKREAKSKYYIFTDNIVKGSKYVHTDD